MPGVPPPEPTSTIGPLERPHERRRRAARRRAAPAAPRPDRGSPSARAWRPQRPATVEHAAASQAAQSTRWRGDHDDVAVRLGALARRLDLGIVLQRARARSCRSTAVIGSSSTRWPVADACSALRRASASSVAVPPRAVAGRVDDDRACAPRRAADARSRSRGTGARRSSGRGGRSGRRGRRRSA